MDNRFCVAGLVLLTGMALCSCEGNTGKEDIVEGTGMKKGAIVGGQVMVKLPIKKPWPVYDVAFSPDGRLLAAGRGYHESVVGGDGEVVVWETKDWKQQSGFSASFTNQAQAIAFTADGKSLFAATDKYIESHGGPPFDGALVFEWTVAVGVLAETIHITKVGNQSIGFARGMALSPNGELIALDLLGSNPAVLRRKTGQPAYEMTVGNGFAFSPNGKSLAAIMYGIPSVRLYDSSNGKELANLDLKVDNPFHTRLGEDGYEGVGDTLTCIRYSGDGKQIAVGVSEGSVRLLTGDLTKQIRPLEVSPAREYVWAIAFAAKAGRLAAATRKRVRLFDTQTGKLLREWGKGEMLVMSVALSPDGKLLAVGYGGKHDVVSNEPRSGCVKVWDTVTGRLVKKLD